MLDGLIGGRLVGKASERTGPSGKPYVTAKVRAPLADGEAIFVSVIAFADAVRAALLALQEGDSVSLSGAITPKVWQDKYGAARPTLDMVAHGALTAYHVGRKRKAGASVVHRAMHPTVITTTPDGLREDLPWHS